MSTDAFSLQTNYIEFKSASMTVPVLLLTHGDLSLLAQQLHEKLAQAPEFFKNSPIMLDLQKLSEAHQHVNIKDLLKLLSDHHLIPIGVRGGREQHIAESLSLNLPVFPAQPVSETVIKASTKKKTPTITTTTENKLIVQPVRSGQRVYATGDLIVLAPVSPGAEIMAEGNIHVYGCLRGRALAGVLGDVNSRIFCSDLRAELISIAGTYQLYDDLQQYPAQKPVHVSLENQKLIIKKI